MAGGNFTANLNSNGLKLNVKNYKLKNNNINLDLYDAATSYENIDYTTSEENINTNLNTNDFDLGESISKASNQLQEIKSTQEEEKPWWDVVFDYAATAVGSVVSGVVDVVENIGDGLIMCGGELASGVASLCGNEDLASEIKKGTQDIVQYDWSEAAYDAAMDALDVDDEIAHGVVHQVGNAVGSMAGYAALSLVPGGAAVTAATGFLAAKGSSAEHAFQSGATFEEASVTSTVAGAAGALSGAALNKVQGAAKGASSIKDVAKLTAKGMAVSAAEPVVNSVTEYATYGKDMVDENGNPLYDNFGEYYVESGGLLNTAIAGGVGGISAGSQAVKGYNNNIKAQKYGTEVIASFSDDDVSAILSSAELSDYRSKWSKRELSSWLHQNFDGIYGSSEIDNILQRINKVSDNYWPTLLKSMGLNEGILGFVDKNSNLYLPQQANKHSAYHEAFHQLSEINGYKSGLKVSDAQGNLHKITGIREYYQDGFNSTLANETLTDFLASKYSDGKIYNSVYDASNVKLWSRLDDAMTEAYGESGANLLLESYLSNDTSRIRNFFQTYSSKGTYDDFVRKMKYYSSNELENMVSSIEKNVYKQNNSFGSRIRSLFGGK